MNTSTERAALEPLSQSDLTVRDPAEDIRDRPVFDRDGEEIGTVKDLMIDRDEARVRFVQLGAGGILGIGEDTFLIPVDAIVAIDDQGVHIDQTAERVSGGPKYQPTAERVSGGPKYQPDIGEEHDYPGETYEYYGYAPYWGTGYAYPAYPFYPPR